MNKTLKLSEVFRLVRARMKANKRIRDGVASRFICDHISALLWIDNVGWHNQDVITSALKIISGRIRLCFSVEQWLAAQNYIDIDDRYRPSVQRKLRAYRLAWLEALEAEFTALGK